MTYNKRQIPCPFERNWNDISFTVEVCYHYTMSFLVGKAECRFTPRACCLKLTKHRLELLRNNMNFLFCIGLGRDTGIVIFVVVQLQTTCSLQFDVLFDQTTSIVMHGNDMSFLDHGNDMYFLLQRFVKKTWVYTNTYWLMILKAI